MLYLILKLSIQRVQRSAGFLFDSFMDRNNEAKALHGSVNYPIFGRNTVYLRKYLEQLKAH